MSSHTELGGAPETAVSSPALRFASFVQKVRA
jgi:hypothetical protein